MSFEQIAHRRRERYSPLAAKEPNRGKMPLLPVELFEDLCRRIRVAVIAVAGRHFFERAIAFGCGRIPVQLLPVVADDIAERVICRQLDANSKAPFDTGFTGLDEIVLVTELQRSAFLNW